MQRADEGVGTAPRLGSLAHEPAVRCRPDTHGKQTSGTKFLFDHRKHLVFVAHAAVGNENDLPQVRFARWRLERQLERRNHLGATVRLQLLHIGQGTIDVSVIRRLAIGKQGGRVRIEVDHIEQIARTQRLDRKTHCSLGLRHRNSVHRAGGVYDKDHLPWHVDRRCLTLVRRHHHEQVVWLAINAFGKRHRARLCRRYRSPDKLEVMIHRRLRITERYTIFTVLLSHADRMVAAGDNLQWHSRIHGRCQ